MEMRAFDILGDNTVISIGFQYILLQDYLTSIISLISIFIKYFHSPSSDASYSITLESHTKQGTLYIYTYGALLVLAVDDPVYGFFPVRVCIYIFKIGQFIYFNSIDVCRDSNSRYKNKISKVRVGFDIIFENRTIFYTQMQAYY